MKISFISLIFQGIPEHIALVTLAFILAKATLDWKKIVFSGIILGLSSYLIRLLPVTFGVHTIINVVLLVCLLNYFIKADITKCVVISLIVYVSIVVVETLLLYITYLLFNMSALDVMKNQWVTILWSIPKILILFLISYIIYIMRR